MKNEESGEGPIDVIRKRILAGNYDNQKHFPQSNECRFKQKYKMFYDEQQVMIDILKRDTFEAYGVSANPRAEKVWSLALKYGRDYGYSQVLDYFDDMIKLIE